MDNRFENFTVTILKLNKLVHKIKLYEMEGYDLKAIHVMCVYYLAERGSLTAGQLCKLTCEDKAAISRALATLREKGYVKGEGVRYNCLYLLTEEGQELAGYINRKAAEAVESAGRGLTAEERSIFYKSLGAIAANLEKYYETLSSGKSG